MSPVHRHEGGFRDEDDSHPSPHRHRHQHHEVAPPAPRAAEPNRPRQRPEVQQERKPEPAPRQERRQPAKEANLFSDEPIGYVSPARRRRPAEVASPARPTVPPEAATPPQPKPRPQRPSVPITPAARSASDTNKAKGTEFFRLGQFAEAEVAYSKALDVLPEGASARILVLNNRAASRLRTGNSAGVVEDSGAVLTLLVLDGAEYNPTSEEDWEGVKLGDALVKALTRRAEAWEMSEKWDKAADDWQRVVSLGTWIGKPKWDIANRGLDRCKRMKGGGETATAPAVSKPKPKPKPVVIGAPGKPSEAVTRLQQANQEQDEEENLRAQLKDSVDARLIAWKGGKETNIRALIASLDMVLWEELEWKRVNLGELVSPAQVKAKYVRAIARLHPDKLSASKATVEHKMIANGVFGALNDAWNAFQQQG
ncbi:hypothetical protein DACRYDRAFT_74193 [Dacryopinax primogenitus]|uniref:Uncharacterized protein n=1 Tax=Dacryopinax primogenitus (strain DJM 731) TaxID=1858805 RepID=M5GC88_DACPD|nr:uncharacterized protein DACRYDRAFT_74193 [Dacryopinax primogenitus]EJU06649.1 hypothetical protein DACRYDRAFT_74193 [Dacryopinax primogenitus]